MRRIIAAAAFLMVVIPCAAGLDANSAPHALRDKGKQPVSAVREITTHFLNIPGASPEPCHFRFTDPFFGYLTLDEYALKEKVTFNFICYKSSSKDLFDGEPIEYNKQENRWVRDIPGYIRYSYALSGEDELKELSRKLDKAIRLYNLRLVNAQGYAYTQEDIIGDEAGRVRRLHYCLIHPPQALCGTGDMGYLSDGPKADLTAYSLKILSSVEFLDDIPAAAESTPNPK